MAAGATDDAGSEGQQPGALSLHPTIGNSRTVPSPRATAVHIASVQVPVSRACPVYGVVGTAIGVVIGPTNKGFVASPFARFRVVVAEEDEEVLVAKR